MLLWLAHVMQIKHDQAEMIQWSVFPQGHWVLNMDHQNGVVATSTMVLSTMTGSCPSYKWLNKPSKYIKIKIIKPWLYVAPVQSQATFRPCHRDSTRPKRWSGTGPNPQPWRPPWVKFITGCIEPPICGVHLYTDLDTWLITVDYNNGWSTD